MSQKRSAACFSISLCLLGFNAI